MKLKIGYDASVAGYDCIKLEKFGRWEGGGGGQGVHRGPPLNLYENHIELFFQVSEKNYLFLH